MHRARYRKWCALSALLTIAAGAAEAQSFVPPAGYSGAANEPAVVQSPDAGTPALSAIEPSALARRFRVVSSYRRAAQANAKVVGAYTVQEPEGVHLVDVWGSGFMPTLSFGDGRCFALDANYVGGRLSNARLVRAGCDTKRVNDPAGPSAPADRSLRWIGTSWGYGAWFDAKSGDTLVTVPFKKTFEPFFAARMKAIAIMAMNGPDWPGGNVTLVGRIHGRLTIITLEVSY